MPEHQTEYITRLELVESQYALKSEVTAAINAIDDKVDNLRDMVLPLLESSKQTAENTRKIAETMDRFTESQRATNGKIHGRINDHDVAIEGLRHVAGDSAEKKKASASVIVAIISGVTAVIAGLFAVLPHFIN